MKIDIKPISTNKMWFGRRFRTNEYVAWRNEFRLRSFHFPSYTGMLKIEITLYLKSIIRMDIDNALKPILDSLQECKIIENDKYIQEMLVKKVKSKEEYIDIVITRI